MSLKPLVITLAVFLPFLKSYASNLEDKASVGLNTYSDNGGVQVYSPTMLLMKTLSKKVMMSLQMRVDAISAASIRNGGQPKVADTVIGASSKSLTDDLRIAPSFSLTYDDGENALSGGFYYSSENDYEGKALFASYVRQLNEENTALGVTFSQSFDEWKPVIQRELPRSDRKESKLDLSINQLIDPTFSLQAVYSYMYSEGFLSSPYHYVIQDSFARFENYPETRDGFAVAFKGVKLLTESVSMNFSYRYYHDNWNISSHTLALEFLNDLSDKLMMGIRGRYYTQSDASFANGVGEYLKTNQYFGVDYRMSAFDSYDTGLSAIYKPSILSEWKLSASVDYYRTSSNAYIKNWYGVDALEAIYTTLKVDYSF